MNISNYVVSKSEHKNNLIKHCLSREDNLDNCRCISHENEIETITTHWFIRIIIDIISVKINNIDNLRK